MWPYRTGMPQLVWRDAQAIHTCTTSIHTCMMYVATASAPLIMMSLLLRSRSLKAA